jgi:hypothetical protein
VCADIVAKKTNSVKSVKGNSSKAKKKGGKGNGESSSTTKDNAKGNTGEDDAPSTEEQAGKFLCKYDISVSCVVICVSSTYSSSN